RKCTTNVRTARPRLSGTDRTLDANEKKALPPGGAFCFARLQPTLTLTAHNWRKHRCCASFGGLNVAYSHWPGRGSSGFGGKRAGIGRRLARRATPRVPPGLSHGHGANGRQPRFRGRASVFLWGRWAADLDRAARLFGR